MLYLSSHVKSYHVTGKKCYQCKVLLFQDFITLWSFVILAYLLAVKMLQATKKEKVSDKGDIYSR